MSHIEVKLFDKGGELYFRVHVASEKKPGLLSFKRLSKDTNARDVSIVAGALAEYQNENYGDEHDPSNCARAGYQAFTELVSEPNVRVHLATGLMH